MPRAAPNKVAKKVPKKISRKPAPSLDRVLRQQAVPSDKRRVVRRPQHRPAPCVLPRLTHDKFRNIRDRALSEVLEGACPPQPAAIDACPPQVDALDLSVGEPLLELSDELDASFLMSFASDGPTLLDLSEEFLESLATQDEMVPPSAAAVPLVAPSVHEIKDDGVTLDETVVATSSVHEIKDGGVTSDKTVVATPSTSSGSSLGSSGNATASIIVDDEDDDVQVIEPIEDLLASSPGSAPVEQLLLESHEEAANNLPCPSTEDILVAELSRVANQEDRPIPLLFPYRDHPESSDRIRRVRGAPPHTYVTLYPKLKPPYAIEQRIPERKFPFFPLSNLF